MLATKVVDEVESRYFSFVFERSVSGDPFSLSAEDLTNLSNFTQASFFRRYGTKDEFFRRALRFAIKEVKNKKVFNPLDSFRDGRDETIYSDDDFPKLVYIVKFALTQNFSEFIYGSIFSPFIGEIKEEFRHLAPDVGEKTIHELALFYFDSRLNILYQKIQGYINNSLSMSSLLSSLGEWQRGALLNAEIKKRREVKKNAA